MAPVKLEPEGVATVGELETASIATSDPFTILGLWVLGLAHSNINESQLQTYES